MMCGQECFGTLEVFGRIDTYCLDVGLSYTYAVAVLKPAQLLQALSLFKRALGQTGNFGKHLATVGIDAQVLEEREVLKPQLLLYAPDKWDGLAAEV